MNANCNKDVINQYKETAKQLATRIGIKNAQEFLSIYFFNCARPILASHLVIDLITFITPSGATFVWLGVSFIRERI